MFCVRVQKRTAQYCTVTNDEVTQSGRGRSEWLREGDDLLIFQSFTSYAPHVLVHIIFFRVDAPVLKTKSFLRVCHAA